MPYSKPETILQLSYLVRYLITLHTSYDQYGAS